RVRLGVDADGLVQDFGIATESRLPQAPAQHNRAARGRLIVFGAEFPAQGGFYSKRREQSPGALGAARFFRELPARSRQVILRLVLKNRQVRKALALRLPFGEYPRGILVVGNSLVEIFVKPDQPRRLSERQRLQ